jgi:hypothetical protein
MERRDLANKPINSSQYGARLTLTIVKQDGDYLLAVKGNQINLKKAVKKR